MVSTSRSRYFRQENPYQLRDVIPLVNEVETNLLHAEREVEHHQPA